MKKVLSIVWLMAVVIWLMAFALVCVSVIPRSLIREKSKESADYLMIRNEHFYNVFGEDQVLGNPCFGDCSKVDQIADAILLSIAYHIDPEHPLETVLIDRYYRGSLNNSMNESFARSVEEEVAPDTVYLRYWHGSLIFVRPLLMFFSLGQMKIFHGAVIGILLVIIFAMLIRRGYLSEAISFGISMGVVSIWFVPLSLEYTWMFLLALVVSAFAIRFTDSVENEERIYLFFLLTGMFTSYLDFLTTETLTLLLPLLLMVRIRSRKGTCLWKTALGCCMLWGIGYVVTWVSKWLLVFLVLGINPIPFIQGNFFTHLGVHDGLGAMEQIIESFQRNLSMLFPFGYGKIGAIVFTVSAAAGIFLLIKNNARIKKNINWQLILLYGMLGLIVYVRYAVIRHHGWFHYFFTYRAQASVILAICFISLELVELGKKRPLVLSTNGKAGSVHAEKSQ